MGTNLCLVLLSIFSILKLSIAENRKDKDKETPDYCPAEIVDASDYGNFSFPQTLASLSGTVSIASCPEGFADDGWEPIFMGHIGHSILDMSATAIKTRKIRDSGARRICRLNKSIDHLGIERTFPQWDADAVNITSCRTTRSTNAEKELKNLIISIPVLTPLNFRNLMPLLQVMRDFAKNDFSVAQHFLEAVGNLLASPSLFEDPFAAKLAFTLFRWIDEYANGLNLQPGYRVRITTPLVAVQTAQFSYDDGMSQQESTQGFYFTEVDNVQFRLPAEAIQMSLEQGVKQPRLKVTAYSKDLSYHWENADQKNEISSTSTKASITENENYIDIRNDESMLGNWYNLSVEILDASISNLTQEFQYIFHPENASIDECKWTCVFWDREEGKWSVEGMLTEIANDSVICKSTHLTAFSSLIDPFPLPYKPGSDSEYAPAENSIHSHILSILSSIGSAISIIGLAGTILTYGLFRCLRKERSNRLLLNLSIALMFMHLISISSSRDFWNGKCFIPSALLHFFLHASLYWMLMEAHHMHQLLISVFVKPESKFIIKRSLIAWGFPMITVGVCGAIHPEVYSAGRNDICVIAAHLDRLLYYIAYLAPVVLILLFNFGIFCRIFKVLYKQTARQKKQTVTVDKNQGNANKGNQSQFTNWNEKVKTKTRYTMLSPMQIKGAVTVMILVGVGWIVGLLAIGPFEVFFKYLFTICNAGQGAMIFIFRVIYHPQACREWKKIVLGMTFDSSEVSTTSSTHLPAKKTKMSFSGSPAFISTANSVENSLTPSNPDAKDLARTLSIMLREGNHSQLPEQKFPL